MPWVMSLRWRQSWRANLGFSSRGFDAIVDSMEPVPLVTGGLPVTGS